MKITMKDLAASFIKSRMTHPRAVFDEADVLAKDHGIEYERAQELFALYHEMINDASARLSDRETFLHTHMIRGAYVTLRDSNREERGGRCWPENHNGIWTYPVRCEDPADDFYIHPHFSQDFSVADHDTDAFHRQRWTTATNDHWPVTVTIPARLDMPGKKGGE